MNTAESHTIPIPGGEAFLIQSTPAILPSIVSFEAYGGQVLVTPRVIDFNHRKSVCIVLAALGYNNLDIVNNLGIKENKVKRDLVDSYRVLERPNRHAIGRHLLNNNVFTIITPPLELDATAVDLKILKLSSHGRTTKEIAQILDRSELTVKNHLARIADRHNQPSRNSLLLRGLLSRQIR